MRVLIIGLDAFDPTTFERLNNAGRLPHLSKYVAKNGYRRFTVANPPQSEVSWTSIATGLNPGGHGMFDFVHRNPANYALNVSLLPTKDGLAGTQFAEPYNAKTLFEQTVDMGQPATVLWWPAMFPARLKSPVRSLPGLGTPDLLGRLGVGVYFTTKSGFADGRRKTPMSPLQKNGKVYCGQLTGPMRKGKDGLEPAALDVRIEPTSATAARVSVGKQSFDLQVGQWSPLFEVSFKVNMLLSIKAVTQVILVENGADVSLYAFPLQIHPLASPWPYGTPRDFVGQVWKDCGPFPTIGWPQDTTALEDGCINDQQFLDLCKNVDRLRENVLMHQIDRFNQGVLACVFDTLDRIQHMFFRDRPDLIDQWYEDLDKLIGRIEERLRKRDLLNKTKIIILSDHGFSEFHTKAHLNRWLVDNGYMSAVSAANGKGSMMMANWSRTQAYAIGLNSIYLNLAGREGQGSVSPDEQEAVANRLRDQLLQWRDERGRAVIGHVWRQHEAFDGPLVSYGPDLVIGFAPGFRASAQTGLGEWERDTLEPNRDHWGADHCIDPTAVPGVLFSNAAALADFPNPSYRDIPALSIGTQPDASNSTPPPTSSGTEDEAAIEERLRSLGYL